MKKGVPKNFSKFTGKHLCQSLFLNKVAGLRSATLLKKWLGHKCFPVNFAKFLRTPFLQNTSGWLPLNFLGQIRFFHIQHRKTSCRSKAITRDFLVLPCSTAKNLVKAFTDPWILIGFMKVKSQSDFRTNNNLFHHTTKTMKRLAAQVMMQLTISFIQKLNLNFQQRY